MNKTFVSTTALAAITLAGAASAATVNWGTPIAIVTTGVEATEAPQILTEGTTAAAYTNGAGGTSNGVTFPTSTTITLTESGANYGNWAIGAPHPTQFQAVISGFHDGANMFFTAAGLEAGTQYKVQFFNFNTRNGAATITSGGNSVTIQNQYVIGSFIADSASQIFNISNGGGINAVQIRTIPEPSAALVGGLGLLAMLRRRRA